MCWKSSSCLFKTKEKRALYVCLCFLVAVKTAFSNVDKFRRVQCFPLCHVDNVHRLKCIDWNTHRTDSQLKVSRRRFVTVQACTNACSLTHSLARPLACLLSYRCRDLIKFTVVLFRQSMLNRLLVFCYNCRAISYRNKRAVGLFIWYGLLCTEQHSAALLRVRER